MTIFKSSFTMPRRTSCSLFIMGLEFFQIKKIYIHVNRFWNKIPRHWFNYFSSSGFDSWLDQLQMSRTGNKGSSNRSSYTSLQNMIKSQISSFSSHLIVRHTSEWERHVADLMASDLFIFLGVDDQNFVVLIPPVGEHILPQSCIRKEANVALE